MLIQLGHLVVVVRFGLDDLVLLAEVTFQPAGWLRSGRDWNAPVTFVSGGAIVYLGQPNAQVSALR